MSIKSLFKKKIVRVGLIIVISYLTINLLASLIMLGVKSTTQLSDDQEAIIDQLGKPDTFVLSTNKMHRYEIWNYYSNETAFEFVNGKLTGDTRIPRLSNDFDFPDIDSVGFKHNTTLASIVRKMGGEPTAKGSTTLSGLADVTIYDYFDQVKFGLRDNKLVFMQTLPVPVAQ